MTDCINTRVLNCCLYEQTHNECGFLLGTRDAEWRTALSRMCSYCGLK